MKSAYANNRFSGFAWVAGIAAWACLSLPVHLAAQPAAKEASSATAKPSPSQKTFDTQEQAAKAVVDAAGQFDTTTLIQIFGPGGDGIVFSGEVAQDRQRAIDFAAMAHEKMSISVSPKGGTRAFMLVGNEEWPFPVPIVKSGSKWRFDSVAGRQELLYRRIGSNELDAIQICNGYVEAQEEYSLQPRQGYEVNQYAQRIVSTPGKQDGLAWQNSDGTWGGPIGCKMNKKQ